MALKKIYSPTNYLLFTGEFYMNENNVKTITLYDLDDTRLCVLSKSEKTSEVCFFNELGNCFQIDINVLKNVMEVAENFDFYFNMLYQ